jgi:N-acetylmuramoyl-L-alanine amidase
MTHIARSAHQRFALALALAAATATSTSMSSSAAPAPADPSVTAFVALKKDVEELRQDPEKRKFRHNYEKLIVRLQAVANTHKEGSRADDCAFVAAQLLEELASVSVVSADRDAAIDAFASMAERFPKSNLRDDALLAAARLTTDVARGRAFVDAVAAMPVADVKKEALALRAERFSDKAVAQAKAASKAAKEPSKPEPSKPEPSKPSTTMEAALAKVAETPSTPTTPATSTPTPTTSTTSTPETAPMLTAADTAKVTMRPVAVLPDRPPPGTPSRKVMVIKHERENGESVVRLRISGDVGVMRGEVVGDDRGRRIFYDVAPAKLGQRNIQPIEVHDGVVARVRAGQYDVDVVRLVIELEGKKEPVLTVTRKPFELVLTSPQANPPTASTSTPSTSTPSASAPAPTPAGKVAAVDVTSGTPPPGAAAVDPAEVKARLAQTSAKNSGGISISKQLGLKVHRVVLDAGHGGHDVGAIGPSGVKEKDVTLQITQRVKEKLNAELPDVEVILTRDDDRTLALQDRTNTANTAAADLFISIHANASPIKRVRGVETYYLNITHDRYAMRLAARENAELGEGSISDLDFILADLAMKSNVDDSVGLGRMVQKSVMKRLHQTWGDVPDLGLKHALFYVLMGNKMPSILVETSFLSNKTEEKRLASAEYQDAVADGIVDGVRAFVEERQAFYKQ